MTNSKRGSKEETRRNIIDAAIEVFADSGFFGARVSDVATRAGVADGTIYIYFRSKDDLLISLFREKMAEIQARVHSIATASIPSETKIDRYISEHLALVEEQPKLMQVLTVEIRQSARFLHESAAAIGFARYLAILASIIEEGQRSGAFRSSMKPALVARALFGAVDEISLSWVLDPSKSGRNRAEVAREVSELILSGLRSKS